MKWNKNSWKSTILQKEFHLIVFESGWGGRVEFTAYGKTQVAVGRLGLTLFELLANLGGAPEIGLNFGRTVFPYYSRCAMLVLLHGK